MSRQFAARFAGLVVLSWASAGWAESVYTFEKTVDTTFAVPGQSVNFDRVSLVGMDHYATAFVGTYTVAGQTYSGLYKSDNGVVSPLLSTQSSTAGGEQIRSIISALDYENGVAVVAAGTSAGQKIYRLEGSNITTLLGSGDALPNSTATVGTFANRQVAGDASGFAFSTPRSDGQVSLYSTTIGGGSTFELTNDKTRSPIPETGLFVDFPEIHHRDGRTVYIGRAIDLDAEVPITEPAGIFVQSPGNPASPIAYKRQQIVGSGGAYRFLEFEKPRILANGGIAFTGGYIDEANPSNPDRFMGVFLIQADGTTKSEVNSQLALPGLRAPVFEFNGYALEGGAIAFGAVDDAGERYLYTEAYGQFKYILSSYDTLDGKDLTAIRWAGDNMYRGTLSFTAEFADGTSGVYNVLLPEPTSLLAVGGVTLLLARRRGR